MDKNHKEQILHYLNEASSPKTIFEICKDTDISRDDLDDLLKELITEKSVIKTVKSYVESETLFVEDVYIGVDENNVNKQLVERYAEIESKIKEYYSKIDTTYTEIKDVVDSFSKDILTKFVELLGIFVSIFSIIIIDTNAIIALFKNHYCLGYSLIALMMINLTLAIAILILSKVISKIVSDNRAQVQKRK